MTAALTLVSDPPPAQHADPAPPHEDEAWWCGLAPDAGPEARRRCEDVIPELIVELL